METNKRPPVVFIEAHIPPILKGPHVVQITRLQKGETPETALTRLGRELSAGRQILTIVQRIAPESPELTALNTNLERAEQQNLSFITKQQWSEFGITNPDPIA